MKLLHSYLLLVLVLSRVCFQARTQNCEKLLLASLRLSVYLSVRMAQLGSHWMVLQNNNLPFQVILRSKVTQASLNKS